MIENGTVEIVASAPGDAFEAFVRRTSPPWLDDTSGRPVGFEGSDDELAALRRQARTYHREAASLRFLELLSQGWRSHEIASGQLDAGATVGMLDGSVRRPTPSLNTATQRQRAHAILAHAHATALDSLFRTHVESIAAGDFGSPNADRVLDSASAALNAVAAGVEAARHQEEQKIDVVVRMPFACGGRRWERGRYSLTSAGLADLEEWRLRMEAQQHRAAWAAPSGFSPETWPPYEVAPTQAPAGTF